VTDTIFALSSGAPPAAIAVIRLSGPGAGQAAETLSGPLPPARTAALRELRSGDGDVLDTALVLWFPGPASATGEDCVEFQCHGGRAIVAAVTAALAAMPGIRAAQAGEFTRRAFENGRIDLAQAEALADLLTAETELQRRVAQAGYGGVLSRKVEDWRKRVLELSALVEASLDFSDEDDVAVPQSLSAGLDALVEEIEAALAAPRAERLRDGVRVVLAGPPNSGKSSLFNVLIGESRAIVTPFAGTTRDTIEAPIAIEGVPMVLVDTAGIRDTGAEIVERLGIERAKTAMAGADIVLWLGEEGEGPLGALEIVARADAVDVKLKNAPDYVVSSTTGQGVAALAIGLAQLARALLPKPSDTLINARQASLLQDALWALSHQSEDPLLAGEALRVARLAFDAVVGRSDVEAMLDTLFGRFCIGK